MDATSVEDVVIELTYNKENAKHKCPYLAKEEDLFEIENTHHGEEPAATVEIPCEPSREISIYIECPVYEISVLIPHDDHDCDRNEMNKEAYETPEHESAHGGT